MATKEKKLTFEVIQPGKKFSIGARVVTLTAKTDIEDVKLIHEQYPGQYVKLKNEPVNPNQSDDTEGTKA